MPPIETKTFASLYDTKIAAPAQGQSLAYDGNGRLVNVPALLNVRAFGAKGDGVTDDTTAIQSAINDAFAVGGTVYFPVGNYKVTSTLTITANTSGTITFRGEGSARSFIGGTNNDPNAARGAQITYTGATGDVILASLTLANLRQEITVENLNVIGNSGGTSGHGLHFQCSSSNSAMIVTLRDVNVNSAKQTGIFFDGNVFESSLFNVRAAQNGDRGFKAATAGGGTTPGETRLISCVFDLNNVGVDLSGGGHFSFHGLTCTTNTNEGLIASRIHLEGVDLQLEANGTAAGNQASLTLTGAVFVGVSMTVVNNGTGNGMSFTSSLWCSVSGLTTNSGNAGSGYQDVRFDNATSRCEVTNYSTSGSDLIALGTGGGNIFRRGGQWYTAQAKSQQAVSIGIAGTITPDCTKYDELDVTYTAAIAVTIGFPILNSAYHNGQELIVEIFNNSAGTITTSWNGVYHLAGAWTDPAAGKTRRILFTWNNARSGWFEVSRSAADIN